MGVRARAEARFAELRRNARVPDVAAPVAAGWCVSTIARLERNAPALIAEIEAIQAGLDGFVYPPPSLHVSLMGCTQREAEPPSAERAAAIAAAVRPVLAGPPVEVEIGRLNAIGEQVFLEVLTDTPAWAELRVAVADAVEALGEQPIRHADAEPIHLNIARVRSLPDLSGGLMKPARIAWIEVVVTDFVASPETLTVVDLIRI